MLETVVRRATERRKTRERETCDAGRARTGDYVSCGEVCNPEHSSCVILGIRGRVYYSKLLQGMEGGLAPLQGRMSREALLSRPVRGIIIATVFCV
jgi:hypothetical protein